VEGRLRLGLASALAAALVALAPAAHAARTANPSLRITFTAAGSITVTLPDGTPVGATAGTPTTIPAGYYTLLFYGPGECINLPLFELRGPGVNINDDMLGGETDVHTLYATFAPNATYTWHSDRSEATVYTFRASSDVVGTQTTQTTTPTSTGSTGSSAKATSQDIVGSAILPFRGTLAGAVSAAGRLTLAYRGKSVSNLKAGRYTVAVNDRSTTNGFLLQKQKQPPVDVTGGMFLGKRSLSVNLTPGRWLVLSSADKPTYAIVVS
jgi:ABC-type amino acid transport substrate-binding protein